MNITETRPNKMDFSYGLVHDIEVLMWCCVVIGIAIGLILLIKGLIIRKDPDRQKKVPTQRDLISLSTVFLIPSVLWGAWMTYDKIEQHRRIEEAKDSAVFRYDQKVTAEDATRDILELATYGSRYNICRHFSNDARNSAGFDAQLDRFLDVCPKGEGQHEPPPTVEVIEQKPIKDDVNRFQPVEGTCYSQEIAANIDGEKYHIRAVFCDDYEEENLVVQKLVSFCMMNEKAWKEQEKLSSDIIVCDIK